MRFLRIQVLVLTLLAISTVPIAGRAAPSPDPEAAGTDSPGDPRPAWSYEVERLRRVPGDPEREALLAEWRNSASGPQGACFRSLLALATADPAAALAAEAGAAPDSPWVRLAMARHRLESWEGDEEETSRSLEESLLALEAVVPLPPDETSFHLERARIHEALAHRSKAVAAVEAALAAGRHHPRAQVAIAVWLGSLYVPDDAALTNEPDPPVPVRRLLLRLARELEVLPGFEPLLASSWLGDTYRLGVARHLVHDSDPASPPSPEEVREGTRRVEELLARNPGNLAALHLQISNLAAGGRYEEALARIRRSPTPEASAWVTRSIEEMLESGAGLHSVVEDGDHLVFRTRPEGRTEVPVWVTGDFDGWQGRRHRLRPGVDGQLTVRVPRPSAPGLYRYRFETRYNRFSRAMTAPAAHLGATAFRIDTTGHLAPEAAADRELLLLRARELSWTPWTAFRSLELATRALESDPGNPEALAALHTGLVRTGKWRELTSGWPAERVRIPDAKQDAARALHTALCAARGPGRRDLLAQAEAMGMGTESIREELLEDEPDPWKRYLLAEAQLAGRPEEDRYQQHLASAAEDPATWERIRDRAAGSRQPEILFFLASELGKRGEVEACRQALRRYQEVAGDLAAWTWTRSLWIHSNHLKPTSKETLLEGLTEATRRFPDSPMPYEWIQTVTEAGVRPDHLLANLLSTGSGNSIGPDRLVALGLLAREAGDPRAESWLQAAVSEDPTWNEALHRLGCFYFDHQRYPEAAEPLRMALDRTFDPTQRFHVLQRTLILLARSGSFREAADLGLASLPRMTERDQRKGIACASLILSLLGLSPSNVVAAYDSLRESPLFQGTLAMLLGSLASLCFGSVAAFLIAILRHRPLLLQACLGPVLASWGAVLVMISAAIASAGVGGPLGMGIGEGTRGGAFNPWWIGLLACAAIAGSLGLATRPRSQGKAQSQDPDRGGARTPTGEGGTAEPGVQGGTGIQGLTPAVLQPQQEWDESAGKTADSWTGEIEPRLIEIYGAPAEWSWTVPIDVAWSLVQTRWRPLLSVLVLLVASSPLIALVTLGMEAGSRGIGYLGLLALWSLFQLRFVALDFLLRGDAQDWASKVEKCREVRRAQSEETPFNLLMGLSLLGCQIGAGLAVNPLSEGLVESSADPVIPAILQPLAGLGLVAASAFAALCILERGLFSSSSPLAWRAVMSAIRNRPLRMLLVALCIVGWVLFEMATTFGVAFVAGAGLPQQILGNDFRAQAALVAVQVAISSGAIWITMFAVFAYIRARCPTPKELAWPFRGPEATPDVPEAPDPSSLNSRARVMPARLVRPIRRQVDCPD